MAELSPAAQAVRQAAINAKPGHTIPAALPAAVDQVVPESGKFLSPGTAGQIRADILAIAAELDGANSTSQEH